MGERAPSSRTRIYRDGEGEARVDWDDGAPRANERGERIVGSEESIERGRARLAELQLETVVIRD